MSTNASIATVLPNGHIYAIYLHWDGYPGHAGAILNKHYLDAEKVMQMLDLGDVSVLDSEITGAEGHSFNSRAPGQTIFYGRDRGDQGAEAKTFSTIAKWADFYDTAEYFYLFHNGTWVGGSARWLNKYKNTTPSEVFAHE